MTPVDLNAPTTHQDPLSDLIREAKKAERARIAVDAATEAERHIQRGELDSARALYAFAVFLADDAADGAV